jgi:hypothetical protein
VSHCAWLPIVNFLKVMALPHHSGVYTLYMFKISKEETTIVAEWISAFTIQ